MAKKRPPSMNHELLEYVKFLHLHGLVDIIAIIESIPIYYQTQIKKYGLDTTSRDVENIHLQKLRLQNLTYIARHCFDFSFPSFSFDFQTWRLGPFSLDLENELQNLIYSNVFNNAISSKKTFCKRYNITDYDKDFIVSMFKSVDNYHTFLSLVENKDIYSLRDISLVLVFHNHYSDCQTMEHRYYVKNDLNKYKLLRNALKGLASYKKDYEGYIKNLIDLFFNLHKSQSLQNLSF